MTMLRSLFSSVLPLAAILMLAPSDAHASSSGIVRRSTLNSGGCGGGQCHGTSASTLTTLRIAESIDNTLRVLPGQVVDLTLVVSNSTAKACGLNLSVKTSENGNTNAGSLASVAGQSTWVQLGELTHTSPKSFSAGEVSFKFTWTAPQTEGTAWLHAAANAVNLSGAPDAGDRWNFLSPIRIIISPASSVDDIIAAHETMDVAPVPSSATVTASFGAVAGEPYVVNIFDAFGILVHQDRISAGSDRVSYVWNGRMNDGAQAAPGTYVLAIVGERRVIHGRAVIVR